MKKQFSLYKPLRKFDAFHSLLITILGYAILLPQNIIRYKKFIPYPDLVRRWGNDSSAA